MSCLLIWANSLQYGSSNHCKVVNYHETLLFGLLKSEVNGKEKVNKMTKETKEQINEEGEQGDL